MCLICVDFQKGSLTPTEAWRNLQEMKEDLSEEHHDEVVEMITDKLLELEEVTEDLDISQFLGDQLEDLQLEFEWDEWDDLQGFGEDFSGDNWMKPAFED